MLLQEYWVDYLLVFSQSLLYVASSYQSHVQMEPSMDVMVVLGTAIGINLLLELDMFVCVILSTVNALLFPVEREKKLTNLLQDRNTGFGGIERRS